ncbi:hypothetical protein [Chromohalobacter sp. 48-RD10]|uniref:hypothetical protein n=1 Tax=Chromohalobacter sp. 48-RD10 TaxID=2994063 RepID=UPI002469A7B4|nr:hypothetical protein [Chromohalobacter sp. 48-RD10]
MPQIETLARQAWQLCAIDDIADLMSKPTSAIERWIDSWTEITQQVPPWHEELNCLTVYYLKKAGIITREGLVEAWKNDNFRRGQPRPHSTTAGRSRVRKPPPPPNNIDKPLISADFYFCAFPQPILLLIPCT